MLYNSKKKRYKLWYIVRSQLWKICTEKETVSVRVAHMISFLFRLFFSCFYFFSRNVNLEIMTVEFPRLFCLHNGLGLCHLAKVLLIHGSYIFWQLTVPRRETSVAALFPAEPLALSQLPWWTQDSQRESEVIQLQLCLYSQCCV